MNKDEKLKGKVEKVWKIFKETGQRSDNPKGMTYTSGVSYFKQKKTVTLWKF